MTATHPHLDILTAKGLKAAEAARQAVDAIEATGRWKVHITATDEPSAFDVVLHSTTGNIIAPAEIKARWMSHHTLMTKYEGKWLISESKLRALRAWTDLNHVPAYGILYCMEDGAILIRRLWDGAGLLDTGYCVAPTSTQKTVNGGTAVRNNAYIRMDGAEVIQGPVWGANPFVGTTETP